MTLIKEISLVEWLTKTSEKIENKRRKTGKNFCARPELVCKDGLTLSVQASERHRSIPADIVSGEDYGAVEVFAEGKRIEALEEYMDLDGTYPYVSIFALQKLIDEHGGIKRELSF